MVRRIFSHGSGNTAQIVPAHDLPVLLHNDLRGGTEIITIFDALRDEGRTIIVVTHDPEVAVACERQVHIRDGRIVAAPAQTART